MSPGIFQDAILRSDISDNPSHHFENEFLQYDTKGSRFQDLDENVGLVLKNSADLVSPHYHVPQYFPFYRIPIRKQMMPNSMNSKTELRMVLLEQVGFQRRFPKYQWNSVYRAALQNRG